MAWDIRQNLTTGDWLFDSKRDLQSVESEHIIQQRVHVRLMVERGEFIYDRTGTLGSRLRSMLNMGINQGSAAMEMLIREALTPMEDIAVSKITIFTYGDGTKKVTDPRAILAKIEYSILFALDQDLVGEVPGQFSTQVTIPV